MDLIIRRLVLSIIILFIGTTFSLLVSKLIKNILKNVTKRTSTDIDDFLVHAASRATTQLGITLTISLAWNYLPVEESLNNYFINFIRFVVVIIIIRLINVILIKILNQWTLAIKDSSISSMVRSVIPLTRATTWSIGIVLYLQNIGVQMAAIWALLSAGGIGAGLALKEPVQEFFEYITILLDKPFQNGEFIHIQGVWAKVERVGVRSTRLRSINGEIIVMSNSSLTNGIISNYAQMENRRIVHKIGVVYETSTEHIKLIPTLVKEIIDNTEDAIYDRCHFISFGDFSLDFEIVYFIPNNNYLKAMDAQQRININIMEKFKELGINFAFPTQTIHVDNN
tara:strand:- start:4013 stop:5032 length:1020 start_codon:yes stop_codon:yes gene_type:complete